MTSHVKMNKKLLETPMGPILENNLMFSILQPFSDLIVVAQQEQIKVSSFTIVDELPEITSKLLFHILFLRNSE